MAGYPLTDKEKENAKKCICLDCGLCFKKGNQCNACETPVLEISQCNCIGTWK